MSIRRAVWVVAVLFVCAACDDASKNTNNGMCPSGTTWNESLGFCQLDGAADASNDQAVSQDTGGEDVDEDASEDTAQDVEEDAPPEDTAQDIAEDTGQDQQADMAQDTATDAPAVLPPPGSCAAVASTPTAPSGIR